MISGLFLVHWAEADSLYAHSDVLLYRQYHNDLPHPQILFSKFDSVYKAQQEHERSPFISVDGINFTYIPGDNGIFVVVVSRRNIDAMLAILFLHQFYQTLCHYLCTTSDPNTASNKTVRQLHKDVVVDNFNLVYELFDECMDYGLVQLTDYNILKEYIKVELNRPKEIRNSLDEDSSSGSSDSEDDKKLAKSSKSKSKNKNKNSIKEHKNVKSTHNQAVKTDVISPESTYINSSIVRSAALSINWRPKGIFYAKNEIFIDIIESCDFLYDLESQYIKRNEVRGVCDVKCYLSGMPTCNLGFNERKLSGIAGDDTELEGNQLADVEVEDAEEDPNIPKPKDHSRVPISNVQFHQCVDLSTVYHKNLINFIPADHKFTLMSYRVEQQKQRRKLPLIMVKPTYAVNTAQKTLQIMCEVSTHFKKRLRANNVQIVLPIDPHIFVPLSTGPDFKYKTQFGDVSYKIDSSLLLWNIDSLVGSQSSVKMMAQLNLESCIESDELYSHIKHGNAQFTDQPDFEDDYEETLDQFYGVNGATTSSAPKLRSISKLQLNYNDIHVKFTIPMLSYLGLKITYVKVEEEQMKYSCFPWIRYLTQSSYDSSLSQTKLSSNYVFNLGPSSFKIV